ncbi:unnamed protein product [Brassica oleracea]
MVEQGVPDFLLEEPQMMVYLISSATKEAIEMVHAFISSNPCGHPAKFLLERLVAKAAVPVASFLF